jgi:hypothetical protein
MKNTIKLFENYKNMQIMDKNPVMASSLNLSKL